VLPLLRQHQKFQETLEAYKGCLDCFQLALHDHSVLLALDQLQKFYLEYLIRVEKIKEILEEGNEGGDNGSSGDGSESGEEDEYVYYEEELWIRLQRDSQKAHKEMMKEKEKVKKVCSSRPASSVCVLRVRVFFCIFFCLFLHKHARGVPLTNYTNTYAHTQAVIKGRHDVAEIHAGNAVMYKHQ
jgi:hypothetical protein